MCGRRPDAGPDQHRQCRYVFIEGMASCSPPKKTSSRPSSITLWSSTRRNWRPSVVVYKGHQETETGVLLEVSFRELIKINVQRQPEGHTHDTHCDLNRKHAARAPQ
jgi:hypothetical protein